jgi:ATP-dependent RNA helicase HelY
VARALERAKLGPAEPSPEAYEREPEHPVSADPDLAKRLKAAGQAERVGREVEELQRRVRGRNESLARRFDRLLALLDEWGYTDSWALTDAGHRLARLFHESDLLIVEALRRGLLDGLDPATFAAMASVFTYEHRSSDPPPPPWFPSNKARKRWLAINELAEDLNAREDEARLATTRPPDPTFAAVAYAWAAGESFSEVVSTEELSGGDFVRNIKQLLDLVRQIGEIAPVAETRATALAASELLFRGVVAASSTVGDQS